MTKAEIRRQRERLQRAFSYWQRRLRLNLHLEFLIDEKEERVSVQWSNRGEDDRSCFLIRWNPEAIARRSRLKLLSDCLHDAEHAIWWPLYEFAYHRIPRRDRPQLLKEFENCAYTSERAHGPHLLRVAPEKFNDLGDE